MKGCMECGKKLGVVEGYRHPTMGKNYLLCSSCFDTVFASVGRYQEFVSPYVDFFNKETSTMEDIHQVEATITKTIKRLHTKVSTLWPHKTHQNALDSLSVVN
jgi:hypothetical protein